MKNWYLVDCGEVTETSCTTEIENELEQVLVYAEDEKIALQCADEYDKGNVDNVWCTYCNKAHAAINSDWVIAQ